MSAKTPVLKEVSVNGVDIRVHACPWPLYRKIYGTESGSADTLGVIEEVVRECVDTPDGVDITSIATRQQMTRLFEIAVSDEGATPDF